MKLGFYNQLYCFKSWECGQPATWPSPVDSGGQGKLLSKIRKDQRSKRTSMRCGIRELRAQAERHQHLQYDSKSLIEI